MLTKFEENLLNEFKGIIRRENPHDGGVPFSRKTLINIIKRTVNVLEDMKGEE